jgi:8-oxo-dGTP pyrophosphatase MutT (NUDIX family)
MADLKYGSCCILELPDGKLVFQRRSNAKISPLMLDLYGGHAQPDESHLETLKRELAEETSIDVNHLKISYVGAYTYPGNGHGIYLYKAAIKSPHFKTYEGLWEEVYSLDEAIKRDDITDDTVYILKKYRETLK